MEEEFDLVGQPFAGRAQRGEEMIEVMRKLWTGEMVEHHGRHFDFPRLLMSPAVRHRIPIFVGGRSDAALRRAARIGDGWIPDILSRDELARGIAPIRRLRADAGARGEPFEVIAAPKDGFDVDALSPPRGHRRDAPVDDPVAALRRRRALARGQAGRLERFADEVIAKMR